MMGSGSLWLASIALGRALGWLWYIRAGSELYLYSYQYPRGSHAFLATIIIELDGDSYISIPRYLGMALVAREAYGRLPLFEHMLIPLFNLLPLFHHIYWYSLDT